MGDLAAVEAEASQGRGATPTADRAPRTVPAWAFISALAVGGGGLLGGGSLGVLLGSDDAARLERLDERADRFDERADRLDGRLDQLATDVEEAEGRMLHARLRTLHWIVDALTKQSNAIAAIASSMDVEVDLRLDPLIEADK